MRLLYVVDFLSVRSGGLRMFVDLALGLGGKFDIRVVTGRVDEGLREALRGRADLIELNVGYEKVGLPHECPPCMFKFLLKSLPFVKDVDVAHTNAHLPNLLPYFRKVRSVCSIHHLEDPESIKRLAGRLGVGAVQALEVRSPCSIFHVPSKYVARALKRRNLVVIPPGVKCRQLARLPREVEPNVIVSIGRLERRKNYADLITALYLVKRMGLDARLYIVGGGPEREALEGLARRLGLGKSVVFLGGISEEEKLRLLSRAVALVHLGYPEGLGMAVLEALAAGLPLVVYDVPPYNELVAKYCKACRLVRYKDVGSLAKAIAELLEDPLHGRASYLPCEEYDAVNVVRKFEALYRALA